jgi:hypothetical protein
MGFTYSATALQTSGYYANTDLIGFDGQLRIVHGVWDMGTDTTGEIVTGLSYVHAGGVSIDTKSNSPTLEFNKDGAGTTSNGSIGIIDSADIAGQWWAIGSP